MFRNFFLLVSTAIIYYLFTWLLLQLCIFVTELAPSFLDVSVRFWTTEVKSKSFIRISKKHRP